MALYLDSASPADARRAAELEFVSGITTNPELLAGVTAPAEKALAALCDALTEGLVFYQLTAPTLLEREDEAYRIADLRPGRIAIKVPCTTENLSAVPRLSSAGLICAVTAVFSPYQALLSVEVGADYVIPYVNRATRQLGDGVALVEDIAGILRATGAETELLAASFRSLTEVARAVQAGAQHVTLALEHLQAMGDHPLSERAIEGFARFL